MKKIMAAALIAVTAVFFVASCQKEIEKNAVQQREIVVLAESVDDNDSKNYISDRSVYWGSSEYLMLYYNDGADKFSRSLTLSAGSNEGKQVGAFRFSIPLSTASSYKIGGMYPASAAVTEGNNDPAAYKVVLPAIQEATASSYDPAAYIMYMKPEVVKGIPSPYTAYYKRAVALNKITLTGLSSSVSSVTIEAPGKNLAGGCKLNLVSGEIGSVYSGVPSVEVKYSTPLSAYSAVVWFTSWGTRINPGETLNIRIKTASGSIYNKTVTAGGAGIRFNAGCLNCLEVNCSSLTPATTTLKDFAEGMVSLLDVWEKTSGTVVVNGVNFNGNYLPASTSFTVNGVTYNKAKAYDVAAQGVKALVSGGSLLDKLPSARSYSWGSDPYNESSGNGGAFTGKTVSFDFIQNFINRQEKWVNGGKSQWANFCSYTTTPTVAPVVTGYGGVCCLERALLILARFYEYLLDNSIYNSVPAAVASTEFDAGLYNKNIITGDATIKDFASQLSSILATWRTTKGNVGGKYDVHYIPAYATITFNGEQYNKSQMLAGAMTAFQLLYSGKSTSTPMPYIDRSYSYSLYPWTESTEFSEATVGLPFINTMVNLAMANTSSSGAFPDYQQYPVYGRDSQSASAGGRCCTDRMLLILTRFLQYLVDNNINSNIASACSSVKIDSDLFGLNMSEQNVGMWLNSRDMSGVSLSQLAAKGIDTIFLSFAAVSAQGQSTVKKFIADAEAQGIEVHIWMQCCYRNGSWVTPLVSSGGTYVQNQSLFDTLVAEAKTYANLGVRGINLDYMRFSGKAYNYGTSTASAAVTEMVRQIYVAVKGIDNSITLSGCFMGESVSSLTTYYGQDVANLGRYLDIVLPMIYRHDPDVAYSSQTCINLANSFTSSCKTYNSNCKCWPATDTYSGSTGLPASTIRSDISDFKSSKADGVAIFRYGIGTIPDISDLYK